MKCIKRYITVLQENKENLIILNYVICIDQAVCCTKFLHIVSNSGFQVVPHKIGLYFTKHQLAE